MFVGVQDYTQINIVSVAHTKMSVVGMKIGMINHEYRRNV